MRVALSGGGGVDFGRGRDSSRLVCYKALGERIDFLVLFFFQSSGTSRKEGSIAVYIIPFILL